MKPFFPYLFLCIPFVSYITMVSLNHIIEIGYRRASTDLEFPDQLTPTRRTWRRVFLFSGTLGTYTLAVCAAASWPSLLLLIFYMALLTAIIIMDFEQQLILDEFTLALALLALLATPILPTPLLPRLAAGAGGFLLFLLLAVLTKGGIGGGDIKLIGALGLYLGPDRLFVTVLLGILGGGLVSLYLLLTKKKKRTDRIAYGPYFALAAILAIYM